MTKAKKKPLSDKHKAFIDAYIHTLNATRAYMQVYKGTKYESARAAASALLTNLNIKAEIDRRFDEASLTSAEIVYRLSDMAKASHYPFIEIDTDGFVWFNFADEEAKNHLHLIKKIKTKRERRISGKGEDAQEWEGEWVEVELHDAKDALIQVGKIRKLFEPEKGEGETFTAPQVVEIIKTYQREQDE